MLLMSQQAATLQDDTEATGVCLCLPSALLDPTVHWDRNMKPITYVLKALTALRQACPMKPNVLLVNQASTVQDKVS